MARGDHERPVIFIGWDGADPAITNALVKAGKLPVLARLSETGTGGTLAGYAPFSRPMQWTTMATGKLPPAHGIRGWRTVRNGRVEVTGPLDRGTPAFWNRMAEQGISCGVIDWPASLPEMMTDHLQVVSTRVPEPLSDELEDMRVTVQDLDPGLLGLFVPRVAELDAGDPRIDALMTSLARLYTTHNIAMRLRESARCLAVRYDFLRSVAEHAVGWRKDRDAEIFDGVLESAYRVQDLLLGDLWSTAGGGNADIMVVSDYEPAGMFAMSRLGVAVNAMRLEDVAPTLLSMVGLSAMESADDPLPEPSINDSFFSDDAEMVKLGNDERLGRALLALNRPDQALAPLERCYFREPESMVFAHLVGRCRARLGMFTEAKHALATIEDSDAAVGALLRAEIALVEGRSGDALAVLEQEEVFEGLQCIERQRLRWQALLLEKQYSLVDEGISKALMDREAEEIDLILLSHVKLYKGNFQEAADLAKRAMASGGRSGAVFNLLGQSLERLGEFTEARLVYEEWLRMEPGQEFASQRVVALAKDPPRPLPKMFEPSLVRAKAQEWFRVREASLAESAARLASINNHASVSEVTIRPAHDREKGRIARHFQIADAPEGFSEIGEWVTVVGPERRIVAVWQMLREVRASEDKGATIHFSILPRWRRHRSVTDALELLEEHALALGVDRLRLQADPESDEGALWRTLGFQQGAVREIWKFEIGSHLGKVVTRAVAKSEVGCCKPLGSGNLEEVARLCAELDLLPTERVFSEDAFDPRISFVVRDADRLLGVLLSRFAGKTAYLEVFAKRPDVESPQAKVVPMLLLRFRDACVSLGIDTVRCIIRPDLTPGLSRLIARSGGNRLSRFARFEKKL